MNLLTRMNIRSQLLLIFFMLIIPIIILNWYGNEKAEDIIKNQVTDAYVELIKQNHSIIDRDIDTVHKITTACRSLDSALQKLVRRWNQEGGGESPRVWQRCLIQLKSSSSKSLPY